MDKKILAVVAVVAVVAVAAVAVFALGGSDKGDDSKEGAIVGNVISEKNFPNTGSRLWVYGNANEDDKIDESDLTYLQGILDGKNKKTVLADANGDGVVDSKDLDKIKQIIKQDKTDVYYIDNYFTVAKVSWPVNTIAIGYCSGAYAADVTGVCDKVVMVDTTIEKYWTGMNPAFKAASSFGSTEEPDYEAMMAKKIDVYVPGYADASADKISPSKLTPVGIDVMFMSTADNSGVDYPNEFIDRSTVMFGFLLQGDLDKIYSYLEWHDDILQKLKDAGKTIKDEDKAAFMMSRNSPLYATGTISITGYNNTNNIHAEWVGVDAVGQHSSYLPKNYNNLDAEQILTVISQEANNNTMYYMDNEHDGMRHQRDLDACILKDAEMLKSSSVNIHYMGMAREGGNSPMYVVELVFYQNVMYPELSKITGLDYKKVFAEYFEKFASYDYTSLVDINDFFKDYGVL